MPKASPIQTAFNAGEFSSLLNGQVSLEKRASALETCVNMIALKQGPVTRRGGTKYVKEVKNSSNRTALIDFQFSSDQKYQIEIGDQYFRFYRNNAIITEASQAITNITQANPAVVTYAGADTYTNGKEVYISGVVGMTQVNGKFFTIANVNTTANTFELSGINSTSYTAYSSVGTAEQVYEISTPYIQADLFDSDNILKINFVQSGDVLYLFHGNYQQRSLTRSAHASWALTTLILNDGPYLDANETATTLTLSAITGSVTVTASAITGINNNTGFQTTDVGRLIRWRDPANNWTWLKITAWASTTSVTATISGPNASAVTGTINWRLGVWSNTTGWPVTGTFFQDRLCSGGASSSVDRYDMTQTGGYSNTTLYNAPSNAGGTVAADDAISGNLPSLMVNAIVWMAADTTGLIIGTTGQEWVIRSGTSGDAVSPANRKADPISSTKSAPIRPVVAGSNIIFIQAAKRRLHDMSYSFEIDRLKPTDLNLFSEHITRSGIISLVYQQEPINVIWSLRLDGILVGLTYYPDQNVYGWHRHIIGGFGDSGKATNSIVESISVIPSASGKSDELWMIVNRNINGVTKRYVEYMTHYYENTTAIKDSFQVDSGLTYSGAATNTISGLDHLFGETVKVMVDGKAHPDLVVGTLSAGRVGITLASSVTGSTIQIGLANRWEIKTLEIEAGAADGTAQGKTKRITNVVLKLLNALGLFYGPDANNASDEYDFEQGQSFNETPTLYTGNTPALPFPSGYDSMGQMYFTDNGVFPMTICAIMPQIETQDR